MCRLPAMLADRLATSYGGPVDFPYPASGASSVTIMRFDTCTMAPETWPLPTVSRAQPPATSINCPAASDEGGATIPRPIVLGLIDHCASPVALSPYSPTAVLRCFGCATTCYVDRSSWDSDGVLALAGNGVRGRPAGNRPSPFAPLPAIRLWSSR